MIADDLRNRWRFFLEHAGYATPPGRAACALALARAEQLLEQADELDAAAWTIEDDPEPYDPGDATTLEQARELFESGRWTGPYWLILKADTEGEDSASIGGVVVGPAGVDDPYIRVCRAELALELHDELAAAIARAQVRSLADELAAHVGAAVAIAELRAALEVAR